MRFEGSYYDSFESWTADFNLESDPRPRTGTRSVIYDVKTGKRGLTPGRIDQIRGHLPEEFNDVPIEELRPR